jgi:ribosomal protein S18 acetylase RimI-like enzyme
VLIIREYTPEDIAAIVLKKSELTRLHTAMDPNYYSPSPDADEEFKKYLDRRVNDADFKIFVAKDDTGCAGYVMGWIEQRPPIYEKRKVGYLSNIFVDEAHQKQAVGEKLYRRIEEWFKHEKVDFIEIRADARNRAAIKSFKKYGFQELSITFYKYVHADRHE